MMKLDIERSGVRSICPSTSWKNTTETEQWDEWFDGGNKQVTGGVGSQQDKAGRARPAVPA